MILESGIIVAGGLLLTFAKCNWKVKLWMLSNPVFMDLLVFVILFLLHAGTFSGVMVATIGAFITSGMLTSGRYIYGYMENGSYVPGRVDISDKILSEHKPSWITREWQHLRNKVKPTI